MMPVDQSMAVRRLLGSALLAVVVILSGCTVQFLSRYDAATDRAVTELQKKTESHLVSLEAVEGLPDCRFESHQPFYREAKVDVSSIGVRTAAIPDNERTAEQVRLLASSLDSLEQLHRLGCLSKEQLAPLRIQFNSSFTAILRLELAKRRGE